MENGTLETILQYLQRNETQLFVLTKVYLPRDNECSISAQGQITTVAIFTISDIQEQLSILFFSNQRPGLNFSNISFY